MKKSLIVVALVAATVTAGISYGLHYRSETNAIRNDVCNRASVVSGVAFIMPGAIKGSSVSDLSKMALESISYNARKLPGISMDNVKEEMAYRCYEATSDLSRSDLRFDNVLSVLALKIHDETDTSVTHDPFDTSRPMAE